MKILLVSNQACNARLVGNPILYRMQASLRKDPRVEAVDFERFRGKTFMQNLWAIRRAARSHDITHVHFGGVYSALVRLALMGVGGKKLITFHGTDIHAKALKTTRSRRTRLKIRANQKASFCCIRWFEESGFVSAEMKDYLPKSLLHRYGQRLFVQPLGVDYQLFTPTGKEEARQALGIDVTGRWVLFSDVHNSSVKRRDLAEAIVERMGNGYRLLVMCGVKPDQVPTWVNACDMVLLTSDEEGSPNIIRESLAMNKPVFSVDVGDARRQLDGLHNSAIISRDPDVAARQIEAVMAKPYNDDSRELCRDKIDFDRINRGIVDRYERLLQK